jgi:hypothetical protein
MKATLCAAFGGMVLVLGTTTRVAADDPPGVAIKVDKTQIHFLIGKELVGTYHYDDEWGQAKPIFWPLNAPGGLPLTRAWPMAPAGPGGSTDHPHQRSAWFCHGDVIPEGVEIKQKIRGIAGVDFWSVAPGHGRIVCTFVGTPKVKGSKGRLLTHNEWRTADGMKILDETRAISLVNLGKARLLILDIDLRASVYPITFGDTKEGAMGVRVNDAIREQRGNGIMTNAEGKQREAQLWGLQSAWCDYSGTIDDKAAGITIFDDPKNPYPASWHSRGYGLMAANPFGRKHSAFPAVRGRDDLVRLAKGQHLNLRYGILLHEGNVTTGNVATHHQHFVKLREKQ